MRLWRREFGENLGEKLVKILRFMNYIINKLKEALVES